MPLETFIDVRLSDFDYHLPAELIAQHPAPERSESRLLTSFLTSGRREHRRFSELPGLFEGHELLILNDTKVRHARFTVRRAGGGMGEILLLRPLGEGRWEALLRPARRLREGTRYALSPDDGLILLEKDEGRGIVAFDTRLPEEEMISRFGQVPLPPYIKRPDGPTEHDAARYQTTYARETGALAAPTAGLHFTPELFAALENKGVEVAFLTLHVGLGTFQPVRVENLDEHRMEEESFFIPESTALAINKALAERRPVVAVGTTSVRTLESAWSPEGYLRPGPGTTRLFITPGYQFRVVKGLVTNFHLPQSTLYMLVAAFMGLKEAREAYEEAVRERYRFYSFGDAMLIRRDL